MNPQFYKKIPKSPVVKVHNGETKTICCMEARTLTFVVAFIYTVINIVLYFAPNCTIEELLSRSKAPQSFNTYANCTNTEDGFESYRATITFFSCFLQFILFTGAYTRKTLLLLIWLGVTGTGITLEIIQTWMDLAFLIGNSDADRVFITSYCIVAILWFYISLLSFRVALALLMELDDAVTFRAKSNKYDADLGNLQEFTVLIPK